MLKYIKRLRKIGADEWTVRSIFIFCTIAEAGPSGLTTPEIIEAVGLNQAAVHRLTHSLMVTNCPELSEAAGLYPKMGFVEKFDHASHGKMKCFKLTEAGEVAYKYLIQEG